MTWFILKRTEYWPLILIITTIKIYSFLWQKKKKKKKKKKKSNLINTNLIYLKSFNNIKTKTTKKIKIKKKLCQYISICDYNILELIEISRNHYKVYFLNNE